MGPLTVVIRGLEPGSSLFNGLWMTGSGPAMVEERFSGAPHGTVMQPSAALEFGIGRDDRIHLRRAHLPDLRLGDGAELCRA